MRPRAGAWGDAFAADYDQWYPPGEDVATAAECLVELAAGGPVLELGVGTGRIALAVAAAGAEPVWGIDASPAMLAELARKDPAGRITAIDADMATLRLPAPAPRFALVFAAFNTFFLLRSEADQRACLRRCHDVLADHGRLVFELYLPSPSPPGHAVWHDEVEAPDGTRVPRRYEQSASDERLLVGRTGDRGWELRPLPLTELDDLLIDAGFRLESRWRNWRRARFFAAHGTHVSVWRRTA